MLAIFRHFCGNFRCPWRGLIPYNKCCFNFEYKNKTNYLLDTRFTIRPQAEVVYETIRPQAEVLYERYRL